MDHPDHHVHSLPSRRRLEVIVDEAVVWDTAFSDDIEAEVDGDDVDAAACAVAVAVEWPVEEPRVVSWP